MHFEIYINWCPVNLIFNVINVTDKLKIMNDLDYQNGPVKDLQIQGRR